MSSKLIAIVGPTGSGKSTSIRNLDHKETFIINVARKELPFKGANKLYNLESKNYQEVDDALGILKTLQNISEKGTHIKNVIIEDSNYIMGFNLVKKATETGYTKFAIMAKDMVTLLTEARKLRDSLKIFYFSHPDTIEDEGNIVSYKMKTAGKMIDNQIVLEGLFSIALYTHVEENEHGDTTYNFVTNTWRKYPAKSPAGMFTDKLIPNDLSVVVDKIDEFYS